MIESWKSYSLDGFSIVSENAEGKTDFPEFQVIKGNRTGKFGLVDRYGIVKIPCIYDYLKVYLDYNLCSITRDYRNAIYNTDGQVVVPFEEINPLGVFIISFEHIVGFNTIYDLQGNLKVKLPTDQRVFLLSNLYASTISEKGLYSTESGEMLLSEEFKVDKMISTHLLIVHKVFDGFTRYGIYDGASNDFVLKMEFSSILEQDYCKYVARSQSTQDNGTTQSKTLTFVVNDNKLEVEREDSQIFHTSSPKAGCLFGLLFSLLLPLVLYFCYELG